MKLTGTRLADPSYQLLWRLPRPTYGAVSLQLESQYHKGFAPLLPASCTPPTRSASAILRRQAHP